MSISDDIAREKREIRAQSKQLVRNRILIPQPCQECGEEKVEMHHNWSRIDLTSLDVEWYCRSCHLHVAHYGNWSS
jgi:hypothetical protein